MPRIARIGVPLFSHGRPILAGTFVVIALDRRWRMVGVTVLGGLGLVVAGLGGSCLLWLHGMRKRAQAGQTLPASVGLTRDPMIYSAWVIAWLWLVTAFGLAALAGGIAIAVATG
jgi:hypothetical protein